MSVKSSRTVPTLMCKVVLLRNRPTIFITLAAAALLGCSESDSTNVSADSTDSRSVSITNISLIGAPIQPGGQFEVIVSANSVDTSQLEYEWTLPDGWAGDSNSDMIVVTAPNEQAARGEIKINVSDGDQQAQSRVVVATRGPDIESFTVEGLPVEGDVSFSVNAYNLDGLPLTFDYNIGERIVEDQGTHWIWDSVAAPVPMAGIYALATSVSDPIGFSTRAEIETYIEGPSAWSTFRGNRQRTGRSSSENALGAVGNRIWDTDDLFTNWLTSTPAIGPDGTVYIAFHYFAPLEGKLVALHPKDDGLIVGGTKKWEFDAEDRSLSHPTVDSEGNIYFGNLGGTFFSVDRFGNERWRFTEPAGSIHGGSAITASGHIYFTSQDGNLYALNPDGTLYWRADIGNRSNSTPALAPDGTIYVSNTDGFLYAILPTGERLWEFDARRVDDGITYPTSIRRQAPAVAEDGTVYFGNDYGELYAVDAQGEEVWMTRISPNRVDFSSAALAEDGTIYIGSDSNFLYAINPDGSQNWAFETDGEIRSSPTIGADGVIYVGSNDEHLYAINPDGQQRWRFDLGGEPRFSSPAIADDGTLYIGTARNKVFAIR